jgi:hypothetical protein
MKVVISGSRSIKVLPTEAKSRLTKIMSFDAEILVGDAPGVDLLVQEFLVQQQYQKVCVYHAYAKARNNVGGFKTQGGYNSYVERDKAMCQAADYGLAIWDGESRGTRANIDRVRTRVVQQSAKIITAF